MKTLPEGASVQARVRSIGNAVAAVALAVFSIWFLTCIFVIWNPADYGQFGLTIDGNTWHVSQVVPGSPADRAGIKLDDGVNPPLALRDRLTVAGVDVPRPGERISLHVDRQNTHRTVILRARPLPPLPVVARIELALLVIVLLIFEVVGLILVLFRPSRMTWGFYLFAFGLTVALVPTRPFAASSFLVLALVTDILVAAGAVGGLVFCVRFPTNAPSGRLKTIDKFTPYLFVALAILYVYQDTVSNVFIAPVEVAVVLWRLWVAVCLGVLSLAVAALLTTFVAARGLERHRMRWVILGMLCTSIGIAPTLLSWVGLLSWLPVWYLNGLGLLVVLFPLTVAYAVIRHRVIDVRFMVSRSLALGVIISVLALMLVGMDWVFSTKLPSSRFEAAAYAGAALLVGFSLNAGRQRLGRTLDLLFFRQWHRTQQQAEIVADEVLRATSKTELYEPLTAGIADAFSLASIALFERLDDGGFVRVASRGWPAGSIWHLLPYDELARRAESSKPVNIDTYGWQDSDVPVGAARPAVMMPIVFRRKIPAILLCGAHEDGTGLDPDEIRRIRRLVSDAGIFYARAGAFTPAVA